MKKEWTIIILIYADFGKDKTINTDLKKELNDLLLDLKNCPLRDDVEILLLQNIINSEAYDKHEKDFIRLCRIVNDEFRRDNDIIEIDKRSSPLAFQKYEELGKIFYDIHHNNYIDDNWVTKAKHYLLLTWDHGSGFGIFRRNEDEVNSEKLTFINLAKNFMQADTNYLYKILQKKETPKNFIKVNGKYRAFERTWEQPIYSYYNINKQFLFELDTQNFNEKIIHNLLKDAETNSYVRLKIKKEQITLELSSGYFSENLFKSLNAWGYNDKEAEYFLKSLKLDTHGNFLFILPIKFNKILDILTNEELAKAIKIGFGKKNIDVLLMMNCYMMNVHSCYALKDTVKFLVAPQGEISEPGYNYAVIIREINKLVKSSHASCKKIAQICVDSSRAKSSRRRGLFKRKINKWAVIALRLESYGIVADILDEIAKELSLLKKEYPDIIYILDNVRNRCVRFDDVDLNYYFIDIKHFIIQLINDFKNNNIETKSLVHTLSSIHYILSSNNIASRIGKDLYSEVQAGMLKFKPSAMSIYFPQKLVEDEEYQYFIDRYSENQCALIKDKVNWLLFLQTYFA